MYTAPGAPEASAAILISSVVTNVTWSFIRRYNWKSFKKILCVHWVLLLFLASCGLFTCYFYFFYKLKSFPKMNLKQRHRARWPDVGSNILFISAFRVWAWEVGVSWGVQPGTRKISRHTKEMPSKICPHEEWLRSAVLETCRCFPP